MLACVRMRSRSLSLHSTSSLPPFRSLSLSLSLSPPPSLSELETVFSGVEVEDKGDHGDTHSTESRLPPECLCRSGMTNGRGSKVCNPFIDFQPSLLLALWATREGESQSLRAEIAQERHEFPIGQTSEAAWPKYGAHYTEMWFMFPMETNNPARADGLGLCCHWNRPTALVIPSSWPAEAPG